MGILRVFFFIFITGAFLLSFSPAVVQAESTGPTLFARGKQFFDKGQYEKAYILFMQAFEKNPEKLDYSFYLGRAAFETGDYEMAVMSFERILIMDPNASRVKLELARSFMHLKAHNSARQYFNEVMAGNPPPAVQENIEHFLTLISDAEKKHFLHGVVASNVAWDDNVRSAPGDETININGLSFTAPDLSETRHDRIYRTNVNITHEYRVPASPFSWKTSVYNYNAFYDEQRDLNLNYSGVSTGWLIKTGRFMWTVLGHYNFVDVEYDRYFQTYGGKMSLSYLFGRGLMFSVSSRLEERDYFAERDEMDATDIKIDGGPVLLFGKNRFSAIGTVQYDNAETEANSFDRSGFSVRYDRILPFNLTFFSGYRYQNTEYDAESILSTGNIRADELSEVSGGLTVKLWQSEDRNEALTLNGKCTYTDNDSNISVYKYHKTVYSTGLSFAF